MALDYDLVDETKSAVGLIVLETDHLIEQEMGPFFHDLGYRVYHTRIPSPPKVSKESLSTMADVMTTAARQLSAEIGLDVIGYGCTSGATVIGEDRVRALIREAHPTAMTSDPMSALLAACQALEIKKLGLLTPYVRTVSDALVSRLNERGIDVTSFASFEQEAEALVPRISPSSVLAGMRAVGGGDCDAVFASCTHLRAWEVAPTAESELGKPVLCSNQVMCWHMLRQLGDDRPSAGHGQIFDHGLTR